MNARILLAQAYWKQTDPQDTKTFLIVVGVILLVIVAYNLIKKLSSGSPLLSSIRSSQGFSRNAFRRRASDTGFSDAESEFLEHYARKLGVSSPQSVFGSRTQLDAFIKNAFKYIERHADTEEGADDQKGRLFAIREALQLRLSAGSPARSSRQLKVRTPLSLVTGARPTIHPSWPSTSSAPCTWSRRWTLSVCPSSFRGAPN